MPIRDNGGEHLRSKAPVFIRQEIARIRRANAMIRTLNSEFYGMDGSRQLADAIEAKHAETNRQLTELTSADLLHVLLS